MCLEEIFEFYREKTIPAYADLVALIVTCPQQVLIEESNILSHFAQAHNPALSEQTRKDNLLKAKNHLIRVTLDVHKLVWAALREKLDIVLEDHRKRLYFSLPEDKVLNLYREFIECGRESRRIEVESIGDDPTKAIDYYCKSNAKGFTLYKSLDINKINTVNEWINKNSVLSFLLGIFAGIISSWLYSMLSYN